MESAQKEKKDFGQARKKIAISRSLRSVPAFFFLAVSEHRREDGLSLGESVCPLDGIKKVV